MAYFIIIAVMIKKYTEKCSLQYVRSMKEANEYVSRDPTLYEYAFLYHVMLIQYAIFLFKSCKNRNPRRTK